MNAVYEIGVELVGIIFFFFSPFSPTFINVFKLKVFYFIQAMQYERECSLLMKIVILFYLSILIFSCNVECNDEIV